MTDEPVTSDAKPRRRWFQYSLRSLLGFTLLLAFWLGFEVWQARRTQRTVAAIRALGGEVELERAWWTVLGRCGLPEYGQCLVKATIHGSTVADAVEPLATAPHLREVRVLYDGTCDIYPHWDRLTTRLEGRATVAPQIKNVVGFWGSEGRRKALDRFDAKLREGAATVNDFRIDQMQGWHAYLVLQLPDGSVAEVLADPDNHFGRAAAVRQSTAILLVKDVAVDVASISWSDVVPPEAAAHYWEDLDHDGFPEMAFQAVGNSVGSDIKKLPGDPRCWIEAYAIEPDGFRSLFPK